MIPKTIPIPIMSHDRLNPETLKPESYRVTYGSQNEVLLGAAGSSRHGALFTRLVAADESSLLTINVLALVLVTVLGVVLNKTLPADSWPYEFFFKRSFVQWVLLGVFAIGFLHLLWRIPEWLRERNAFKTLVREGEIYGAETLVGRRWLQLKSARAEGGRGSLENFSKTLAEHDEAEVEAAYRLSTDIVQILPLIGFFGTVFGLSHGLYQSFLATGGTSTKDFAKAIAIAFDNTLLGLALTIILFAVQSLLRKREESLLLQLNLQVGVATLSEAEEGVNEGLSSLTEVMRAHNSTLLGHQQELVDLRQTMQDPAAQLTARISQSVADGLAIVLKSAAEQNKSIVADMAAAFSQQLSLVSQELIVSAKDKMREQSAGLPAILNTLQLTVQDMVNTNQKLSDALTAQQLQLHSTIANALDSHADRLKEEIRRPRTFQFMETPGHEGNGLNHPLA